MDVLGFRDASYSHDLQLSPTKPCIFRHTSSFTRGLIDPAVDPARLVNSARVVVITADVVVIVVVAVVTVVISEDTFNHRAEVVIIVMLPLDSF